MLRATWVRDQFTKSTNLVAVDEIGVVHVESYFQKQGDRSDVRFQLFARRISEVPNTDHVLRVVREMSTGFARVSSGRLLAKNILRADLSRLDDVSLFMDDSVVLHGRGRRIKLRELPLNVSEQLISLLTDGQPTIRKVSLARSVKVPLILAVLAAVCMGFGIGIIEKGHELSLGQQVMMSIQMRGNLTLFTVIAIHMGIIGGLIAAVLFVVRLVRRPVFKAYRALRVG